MASRQEFVNEMLPYAQEASRRTGIDPLVILAQAAHESAWGSRAPGNNYFGIKGKGQTFATHEYEGGRRVNQSASFRRYSSPLDSFLDWARLMQKPRYQAVGEADTPAEQIAALKAAGYATDPRYTSKVLSVANRIAAENPHVIRPASPAMGARAAADLQGYLPAGSVPEPRLRPTGSPSAIAARFPTGSQIDQFVPRLPALRPSATPVSATAYAPADQRASFPTDAVFARTTPSGSVTVPNRQPYSIPAGPYGADQIIRAVLSNDPAAVQKAFDNVRGQVISQYGLIGAATQQDKASQEIASYFQNLGQESPQLGHAIHNAIQGNRAMLAALPEQSRPAITSGLVPYANEPTVQMPLPRLRPTQPTQAASLAPVSTFPARPAPAVSGNLPAQVRQIGQYIPNTPSARPQGSQPSTLGRIATAATSAGDWLRDVFAPPAKAALPSPTYNATSISQYRPMVQKPTASATPSSITQASFNDRFDAKPAVDYATGARAASGLQGYVPPPTVPLNLPNSAATMGIQPKPKAATQTLQIAPPQTPVSKPLSILNPDWVEWEKATQANPELRPFLKAPTQWIPGPVAPITPIPKQKPLSVVVTPVAQPPPPPVNRVNGPTSQAARAGQPYYGTRSSSPSAGPTWSGTSPTSSGGANYNYRISSDGKTVSWTNSAGQTLTAARNV